MFFPQKRNDLENDNFVQRKNAQPPDNKKVVLTPSVNTNDTFVQEKIIDDSRSGGNNK